MDRQSLGLRGCILKLLDQSLPFFGVLCYGALALFLALKHALFCHKC
jgi:hypothetical protein